MTRSTNGFWIAKGFAVMTALGVLAACSTDVPSQASTATTPAASGSAPTTESSTTASTVASTSTSSSTSFTTTTVDPDVAVAACVATWPIEQQVAMTVWPAVYSSRWQQAIDAVGTLGLGGVVVMGPDDAFAASLADHLAELDAVSPHGVLVATDEEGGRVQRLAALGVLPSQEEMSSMPDADRRDVLARHASIIAAAGVDVVLAPVVDVRPATGRDPLRQGRLFVGDPDTVAALGGEYVQAWLDAGVLPVLKHFPGHGSASTDSHRGLSTTPPLDQLLQRDLVPYRQLAASGAGVMVGHLVVPGLTGDEPASLSSAAYALLRGDMGFSDALVVTDALGMKGVGTSVTDAAVRAIAAGADVVLFTESGEASGVVDALVAAVADGRIPRTRMSDAATRVAREIERHGTPCRPTD